MCLVTRVGLLPPLGASNGHHSIVVQLWVGRVVVRLDMLHVDCVLQCILPVVDQSSLKCVCSVCKRN